MRRAVAEAAKGLGSVEPNPLVGAVLVREGHLLAVGHHARFGGPHAEVEALRRVAADEARGATLYVTLEPCCHHGKTPPCTTAILDAGITRVVAAMRDPFPRVAGGGIEQLRSRGVEVVVGVAEESARRLNAPYLKRLATGRPYVTAKWAMTLDGKTAVAGGDSFWISSPRSRALVHELRGRMDAILVGVETVRADDPMLTARPPGPRTAVRVVLDSRGRAPTSSRLVTTAASIPTLIATTGLADPTRLDALRAAGCEVLRFSGEDRVPIGSLLDALGARGWTNILVEGGGRVAGSFLDAGELDAVEVFLAPILEGGDHDRTPVRGRGCDRMRDALRLAETEVRQIDGDVALRGVLSRPERWIQPP